MVRVVKKNETKGKERREDVCVVRWWRVFDQRTEEVKEQGRVGGDGSRQREQWVQRAWGGDMSGFFKELVLVGLEQRDLRENDRGENWGENETQSGLWIQGTCVWKMYSWPLNCWGVRGVNTPLPLPHALENPRSAIFASKKWWGGGGMGKNW